jgi:hypothetical protein
VFVLAADTGVTKSDLAIWRDHLGASANLERFVVLNKIDALADPLAGPGEVQAQIEHGSAEQTAQILELPAARVFALSAREAWSARDGARPCRIAPQPAAAAGSGSRRRTAARRQELLATRPWRRWRNSRSLVARRSATAAARTGRADARAARPARQERRQGAHDARARGSRVGRLRALHDRACRPAPVQQRSEARRCWPAVQREAAHRGRCHAVGAECAAFNLGGQAAFETAVEAPARGAEARSRRPTEMRQMLDGSFRQLNTEFGFAFAIGRRLPTLGATGPNSTSSTRTTAATSAARRPGAWRSPGFMPSSSAACCCPSCAWSSRTPPASSNCGAGGATRSSSSCASGAARFKQRREALQRIQSAAGELEQRIAEVESQDAQLAELQRHLDARVGDVLVRARRALPAAAHAEPAPADSAA